ncbi:MAG: mechanosensitive ion channel domain-containing protein [Lapillicoccus sp.]
MPSVIALLGAVLPEPWNILVGTPLSIVITLVLAVVARWVSHRFIDRVVRNAHARHETRLMAVRTVGGRTFAEATGYASTRHQQRMDTTASVLKSTLTAIIAGSALLMILDLLGLPLAPLLASAGVGGLAIGFGAQSLVKDFFSGVFMIAEDQFGVGDVIDTGTVSGTVEEVTLRITRLRDADGVVWYLRNGEILRVGNRSQGWSVAVVDVQVGYREDLRRVTDVLNGAVGPLAETEPWSADLTETPAVTGIESMGGGLVTLRASARCQANRHIVVEREMRERIKDAFDAEGIEMAAAPAAPPT